MPSGIFVIRSKATCGCSMRVAIQRMLSFRTSPSPFMLRAGRVLRDVKDPELISDHMYRMGLMGLIMADVPGVNQDKLRDQLLLHFFFDRFSNFLYLKLNKNEVLIACLCFKYFSL